MTRTWSVVLLPTNHGYRVTVTSDPSPDGEVITTRRREKFALRVASDVVRTCSVQPLADRDEILPALWRR